MFRILYDAPDGVRSYTVHKMDRPTAERMLALFTNKYLNADGSPRPYPNGKGCYRFTNPRIVCA